MLMGVKSMKILVKLVSSTYRDYLGSFMEGEGDVEVVVGQWD